MFLKKYPFKTSQLFASVPLFEGRSLRFFSSLNTNDEFKDQEKEGFLHKSKNRFNRSKLKNIYDFSKKITTKMNLFRFFKRQIDEQKMLNFLQKVQGVTLLSIYETVSGAYLFNYLDFLGHNSIYLIGGGSLMSLGSLYLLQRFDHPNRSKIGKFIFYQGLLLSISMILTPAVTSISSPIIIPAMYVISATSFFSGLVCNQYFVKKKWLLTLGSLAAGIFNSYFVLYGISYLSFVAVGNNPFVMGYQNFWVKNEIYLINGLFAWATSGALKAFKRGETDYFRVALGAYIKLLKKGVDILMFLLGRIKR